MRYVKVGEPSIEAAWRKVREHGYSKKFAMFIALAVNLKRAQPGLPILLPVVLVGKLLQCKPRTVSAFRRRATELEILNEVEPYIAHRSATKFDVDFRKALVQLKHLC
jgi:hypothetical protein